MSNNQDLNLTNSILLIFLMRISFQIFLKRLFICSITQTRFLQQQGIWN